MSGTDGMEDALVSFAAEIFKEAYVMDEEVRRKIVRMMISRGDLLGVTDGKFDLAALLEGISVDEDIEDVSQTVVIPVGLSQSQRDSLVTANPDMKIRFADGAPAPHALAWAQKAVDTNRLLMQVPHEVGCLVDIGGNYMFYGPERGYKFVVHCCNLVDDWREMHRQTQRMVAIESGRPATDFCDCGVEMCEYISSWFISVHTLPCIDPDGWVGIFRRHLFKGGRATFHYDPAMDTDATSGYITEAAMHWYLETRDGVVFVVFHFDNDSSFEYSHRLDWLRRYSRPGMFSHPDWDYVINYRILAISGGCVHSEFTKMPAATVGRVEPRRWLRWIGGENVMVVPVPYYDESSGKAVRDPGAYKIKHVEMPLALYDYAFTRGLVNDTARPDLPLSRDDMLGTVKAYNHSMQVNGVELAVSSKLPAGVLDDVSTGLYLAVVYKAAREQVMLGQITQEMLHLQRRWGASGFLKLLYNCVTYQALSPFLLLARSMQEAIDLVAVFLRNTAANGVVLSLPFEKKPYVELAVSEGYYGGAEPFGLPERQADETPPEESEEVQVQRAMNFYKHYADEIPEEVRDKLQERFGSVMSDSGDSETSMQPRGWQKALQTVDPDKTPEDEDFDEVEEFGEDDDIDEYMTRSTWRSAMDRLSSEAPDYPRGKDYEPEQTADDSLVYGKAKSAVLEFALYMLDVQMGVEKTAKEMMRKYTSGGVLRSDVMEEDNVMYGGDRKFVKVLSDGVLDISDAARAPMAVVDLSGKILRVYRKSGQFRVKGETAPVVFSCEVLKIYNGRDIARKAIHAVKEGISFPGTTFHLIDGIAGCGKTRDMTSKMTVKDMFVTGPKAPLERVVSWAQDQKKFANVTKFFDLFKTVDSAVMHSKRQFKVLYFDEGLMQHSGAIYLLAHMGKADRVVVSGDSGQIRFIDRGSGYGELAYSTMKYWHTVAENNVSERCPADIIKLIQQYLPERRRSLLRTKSPIVRSMRLSVWNDPNDPRLFQSGEYIHVVATTQGDKALMVAKPGFADGKSPEVARVSDLAKTRPVLSVHESQGDTYVVTVSVRLNRFATAIFDSDQHQYVESSRHTVLLWRKTVLGAPGDSLSRRMEEVMALPDSVLEELIIPADPEFVKARLELQAKVQAIYGPV